MVHPTLGMVRYSWRGADIHRTSAVHGLWLLQLAQSEARDMPTESMEKLQALLARTGGNDVMSLRLTREIMRRNNVLVLQ
jgi:hypothetical protein